MTSSEEVTRRPATALQFTIHYNITCNYSCTVTTTRAQERVQSASTFYFLLSSSIFHLSLSYHCINKMERYVARKFFETNMKKYEPTDPLYETYTDAKGKQRRRKVRIHILLYDLSKFQSHLFSVANAARHSSRPLLEGCQNSQIREQTRALPRQGLLLMRSPFWMDLHHRSHPRRRRDRRRNAQLRPRHP